MCGPTTTVPTSRCYQIGVSCPGIDPLDALVKVSDPTGTAKGTIVFGSGGSGGSMYEQFGAEAVNRALLPLLAQGYRLVQRSWGAGAGWLAGPGGTLRLACRYVTLLDRIATDIHTGAAFCVTGNSGGSAEVSYAMAHYGMGRLIDLGVPTSCPPMGRGLSAGAAVVSADGDALHLRRHRLLRGGYARTPPRRRHHERFRNRRRAGRFPRDSIGRRWGAGRL